MPLYMYTGSSGAVVEIEASSTMVDIHIEDGLATFRIAGLHKLWAFKSRIVVPVDDIVAVEGAEAAPRWAGWRIAGTWMPGVITAGTFRTGRSVDLLGRRAVGRGDRGDAARTPVFAPDRRGRAA